MLYALLVTVFATFGGTILTYLYDGRAVFGARLAAGYVLGTTLLGFIGYMSVAVLNLPLRPALLVSTVLTAGLPVALCSFLNRQTLRLALSRDIGQAFRPPRRLRPRRVAYVVFYVALSALFFYLFQGTFYVRDGAIWTDNHNNFGDLPWHLAIVAGFVKGGNFPPQHPEFAGVRLTYPFLIDWETAQLVTAGASLPAAFFWQNFLLTLSLFALFLRLGVLVTRRVFAALLAPILFVFSGGLGFLTAFADFRQSGLSPLAFLAVLPHDYTIGAESGGFRWGNTVTCLLTTQRGLLVAIPLALMVLTLWQQTIAHRKTDPVPFRRLAAAGVLMGLLPLVHGHTFLALLIIGGQIALWDSWRRPRRLGAWAVCFALALALAVPQAWLLTQSSGSQGGKFLGWQPGWDRGTEGFLPFWERNLGLFVPLILVALVWRSGKTAAPVSARLLRFYAPFLLCFLVPNLLRLAPWIWDNIKVLIYWHLASSLVIAAFLAFCLRKRGRGLGIELVLCRTLVGVCVVVLTLSGALDVLRVARGEGRPGPVFEANAVRFADDVSRHTAPNDFILCAPQYNSPILLTGRREAMGYEGHLWSHGLHFEPRKADVQAMFAGAPETPTLLAKYHIRWVVIGPQERGMADYPLNETYWRTHYAVALRSGLYTLYAVGLSP